MGYLLSSFLFLKRCRSGFIVLFLMRADSSLSCIGPHTILFVSLFDATSVVALSDTYVYLIVAWWYNASRPLLRWYSCFFSLGEEQPKKQSAN